MPRNTESPCQPRHSCLNITQLTTPFLATLRNVQIVLDGAIGSYIRIPTQVRRRYGAGMAHVRREYGAGHIEGFNYVTDVGKFTVYLGANKLEDAL